MNNYLTLILLACMPPGDHRTPDSFRPDAETRFAFPPQQIPPPPLAPLPPAKPRHIPLTNGELFPERFNPQMSAPLVPENPRHIPLTNRELFPEQFGPRARRESDFGSYWPLLVSLGIGVGYVAGFVMGRWARARAEDDPC